MEDGGEVGEADGGEELAGEALIHVGTAAEADLVALFVPDLDPEEAEVADVVLGAGVGATGDVEIDRMVEGDVRIDGAGEGDGVGFGVGRGEAAAPISGAGDGSAEDGSGGDIEAGGLEGGLGGGEIFSGDVGQEKVLPDSKAEVTGAELVGDGSEGAHLGGGQVADGDDDADVVEAGLRLLVHAEVGVAVDGTAGIAARGGEANDGEGEAFFGLGEEAGNAPAIDEVFEAGLFAVGTVAVLIKDADYGRGGCDGLIGAEEEAAVGGELAVAGDAGEEDAEVDAGGDASSFRDADGDEADVVGVGEDGDGAAVVEGDVELAREAEEIAGVGDVVLEGVGERLYVEEFGGVEAADGGGRDVADIIGAGAARGQAEGPDRVEDVDDVPGGELADLEVGAGGEIGATGAPALGDGGKAPHLVRGERAAGGAEAEHEGILRGADIEEAMEFEAEAPLVVGGAVFGSMGEEFIPDLERVALVLPELFAAEVADGGPEDDGLGEFSGCGGEVGGGLRGVVGERAVGEVTGEGQACALGCAGEEALQIVLLLGREAGGELREI